MNPVVVTAVFVPQDGAKDALVAAMETGIRAVHDEEGCLLYAIHDADDGTITMIEKWRSQADLDAHASGSAIVVLQRATAPLLAAPVKVTTMTPVPMGSPHQGSIAHAD